MSGKHCLDKAPRVNISLRDMYHYESQKNYFMLLHNIENLHLTNLNKYSVAVHIVSYMHVR